jgi:hypothetical protein
MIDEEKAARAAEEFVHHIMETCPDHMRDIDVVAACGFLISAYSHDQNHTAALVTQLIHSLKQYYEDLANGDIGKKVH